MAFLRLLLSLPWLILREVLIRTDRDYWRMLAVTTQPHTQKGYWDFVEMRQILERSGQYDRTDKAAWTDATRDGEADPEPEEPEEPEEEQQPEPVPEPSPMELAEELLGLKAGQYDQKAFKRAFNKAMKKAHPDHGGTNEAARMVNDARDVIRQKHGWDR